MQGDGMTVTATCRMVETYWEARFSSPGVPIELTTRVSDAEDIHLVVREIVSALTGSDPGSVEVDVVLVADEPTTDGSGAPARQFHRHR